MSFGEYALALGLYGTAIIMVLEGLHGLACLRVWAKARSARRRREQWQASYLLPL